MIIYGGPKLLEPIDSAYWTGRWGSGGALSHDKVPVTAPEIPAAWAGTNHLELLWHFLSLKQRREVVSSEPPWISFTVRGNDRTVFGNRKYLLTFFLESQRASVRCGELYYNFWPVVPPVIANQNLPIGDVVLTQKIMLECNEKRVRAIACCHRAED